MRAGPNLLLPALVLVLAACGPKEPDPGPGGVTVGEARALDEAAEMLDSRTEPPPLPAASPTPQPSGEQASGDIAAN